MDALKLVALDEEDLKIVSAHAQDAVLKLADIEYRAGEKRLLMAMNRFVWENVDGTSAHLNERRRSVLHFERVLAVKSTGIDREDRERILSLLAIRFEPAEAPAGTVELTFAGEAAIRLEVEYIEARLADLGAAWDTKSRPAHEA